MLRMSHGRTARCRRLKMPPDKASALPNCSFPRRLTLVIQWVLPLSVSAHGTGRSLVGHARVSTCLSVTLTSAPSEMSCFTAEIQDSQQSCEERGGRILCMSHALLKEMQAIQALVVYRSSGGMRHRRGGADRHLWLHRPIGQQFAANSNPGRGSSAGIRLFCCLGSVKI